MRVKWEENRMWRDESEDKERENGRKRLGLNECCVTGGTQLANHRGSCDARVASSTGLGAEGTLFLLKINLQQYILAKALRKHLHSHRTGLPLQMVPPCLSLLQVARYNPS